jgi:hypothetical protein
MGWRPPIYLRKISLTDRRRQVGKAMVDQLMMLVWTIDEASVGHVAEQVPDQLRLRKHCQAQLF